MEKKELRKILLEKRKAIPSRDKLSRKAAEQLIPWIRTWQPKVIFTYMSYGTELQLECLMDMVSEEQRWAIPRVLDRETMEFRLWRSGEPLAENRWGIKEPVSGDIAWPTDQDLVLVPCVGLDRFGVRLGYGGGYYDRYFAPFSGLRMVGVIFSGQEMPIIPRDDYDLKLPLICDENSLRASKP